MFEKRGEKLLPFRWFAQRMFRCFLATLVIVAFSLALGTIGYCHFGGLTWDDGLLNAAMILTGMGPVNPMVSRSGKIFSTCFALYSGLAFLSMVAIIVTPICHRLIHHFHLDE